MKPAIFTHDPYYSTGYMSDIKHQPRDGRRGRKPVGGGIPDDQFPEYVKHPTGKHVYKVRRWRGDKCRLEGEDYSLYRSKLVAATKKQYLEYITNQLN